LLYITAPATQVVEILEASVTNADTETNEQLRCTWQDITTLGTPTATPLTPAKHEAASSAAASTVKANVTASEPTYTANTEIGHKGFPSLGGWDHGGIPETRKYIAPGASAGIRLLDAPTSFNCVVSVTFREL
jgi:hypothetical protein